ncbi:multiple epidermal growth factor-like domains protein 11 isoform X2 [Amphibalanus amphitrite]|nr:multiple epidermal growth factor-like domains protein 11 isoform X2 [Amphibalanus amphitrite]
MTALGSLHQLLHDTNHRLADIFSRQESLAEALVTISSRQDSFAEALDTLASRLDTGAAARRGVVLGAPCRADTECGDLRPDAECGADGQCRCAEGLQEVVAGRCLPYPRLSESCRRDADCLGAVADSTCTDGVCSCRWGLVVDAGACRKPRLSEPCKLSDHCDSQNAMCDNDFHCSCLFGYWNDGNITCRPYPRLAESCNSTAECEVLTTNATCVKGKCACPKGFWERRNDACSPGAGYGERCDQEAECFVTSARFECEYIRGICQCAATGKNSGYSGMKFRIGNSSSCQDGIIEIFDTRNYFWRPYTVCGDLTDTDAQVLCRSWGFPHGGTISQRHAIPGSGHADRKISCSGSEETVDDCRLYTPDYCFSSETQPTSAEVSCAD